MKKEYVLLSIITCFIILIFLPFIFNLEIKNKDILYILSLNGEIDKYLDESCYDDGVFYNKKRNISIKDININKILIFYIKELKYEDNNLCDKEFYLEHEKFENIINNGKIIENKDKVKLDKLIKNKEYIEDNKRYNLEDPKLIVYKLDDNTYFIYVESKKDEVIIQLGNSDEGAKYIKYKKAD